MRPLATGDASKLGTPADCRDAPRCESARVLLLVVFALCSGLLCAACGPAESPAYLERKTLPNGMDVRVRTNAKVKLADDRLALFFQFLTSAALDDTAAVTNEYEQLWPFVREFAEQHDLDTVLLRARYDAERSWSPYEHQRVYRKQNGEWSWHDDPKLETAFLGIHTLGS